MAGTFVDCSAWATCVFSYKFLKLVEIVRSEDNIKEVEERLLLFRNTNLTNTSLSLQYISKNVNTVTVENIIKAIRPDHV